MASRFRGAARTVIEQTVTEATDSTDGDKSEKKPKRTSIAALLQSRNFKQLLKKKKQESTEESAFKQLSDRKFLFDDKALKKGRSY